MARSPHHRLLRVGAAALVALLALALGAATAGARAGTESRSQSLAHAKKALQKYIDALPKSSAGSVLVAQGGDVILQTGFGRQNPKARGANGPDTQFAINSMAKAFTSTAIYQLAHQGKLALSDPIGKFFPNAPVDRRDITLRQIMTMTSGLPEYTTYKTNGVPGDFVPITRHQAVMSEFTQPLTFTPAGTQEFYADGSYALLAAIVEQVTHTRFTKYVRTTQLAPLGMDHTGWYGDKLAPASRYAHVKAPPPLHTRDDTNPYYWPATWAQFGSGIMVSRTGDLYKYIEGLCDGSVLSARQQTAAYKAPFGLYNSIGYNLDTPDGVTLGRGGGDDWGDSASWVRNFGHDTTVVLLFSFHPDSVSTTSAAEDLQHIVVKKVPSARRSAKRCVI